MENVGLSEVLKFMGSWVCVCERERYRSLRELLLKLKASSLRPVFFPSRIVRNKKEPSIASFCLDK